MKDQVIYIPVDPKVELPDRRKEMSDYSIEVIGVFSDKFVDYVYYDYRKKEWLFSDGDDLGSMEMDFWLRPVEPITEEEIKRLIELYETVIHGDGIHMGLNSCIDGYYAGCWDDQLTEIHLLKQQILALLGGEK